MKVLVVPRLHKGATVEELQPHATEEVRAVWDLYAEGILREVYARSDRPGGTVLMAECASVDAAREALAVLPLVRLGLLDLEMIPLAPFTHLTRLFEPATPAADARGAA